MTEEERTAASEPPDAGGAFAASPETREVGAALVALSKDLAPEAKIKGIEAGLPEFVPLAPRLAMWGDVVSVVIETATTTERRRLEGRETEFDRKALFALMAAEGEASAAIRGTTASD